MSVVTEIKHIAAQALSSLYNLSIEENAIVVNEIKAEFEGDYTIVLFAFSKPTRKSPDALGKEIGEYLLQHYSSVINTYQVIKGFLNLTVSEQYWLSFLSDHYLQSSYGLRKDTGNRIMVEYSSPNTNKPLHLGHLRNNFLGWSIAEILKAKGNDVVKTCVVNDRGIHISKSMIAWQRFGNGATPESEHEKGDHLVGDYYVKFNDEYKKETRQILEQINSGDFSMFNEFEKEQIVISQKKIKQLEKELRSEIDKTDFSSVNNLGEGVEEAIKAAINGTIKWKRIQKVFDSDKFAHLTEPEIEKSQKQLQKVIKPIIIIEEKIESEQEKTDDLAGSKTEIQTAARQMLIDWEHGKPEVIDLWKTMNSWVYKGFDETYQRIGSDFDKVYYESNTYLLGKDLVEQGLQKGVFYTKEDGSVWVDLTADGLDEKVVQRKDGTSVYITQDIGLAEQKQQEYGMQQSIYVVGDEQNYHFKVLKLICEKLGLPSADGIHHLSYGMVELPSGKMKSREGTVVDADDLIDEMINIAKQKTEELGKTEGFTTEELTQLYNTIGLGALKFFILRVDPKKRMIFNPEESIEFVGFTGPFIQYTHARIKSILRKNESVSAPLQNTSLLPLEKEIIVSLEQFNSVIAEASNDYDPSKIAIYVFNLCKTFNSFYTEHSVTHAESEEKKLLRLQICLLTATVIKRGMHLLGIDVPERM